MADSTEIVATPMRTCVGCRQRAPQNQLLRVVRQGNLALADPSRTQIGRGAYLHQSAACLERAITRRSLARAFRAEAPIEFGQLQRYFDSNFRPQA